MNYTTFINTARPRPALRCLGPEHMSLVGIEPTTNDLEGHYSIQLSYKLLNPNFVLFVYRLGHSSFTAKRRVQFPQRIKLNRIALKDYLTKGRWPSGSWQQTVVLPTKVIVGSNPTCPKIIYILKL